MSFKPLSLSLSAFAGLLLAASLSTGCKKSGHSATAPSTMSATLADSSYQASGQYVGVGYVPADTAFTITAETPGSGTQLLISFGEPFTLNVPFSTQTTNTLISFEVDNPNEVFLARGCCQGHATITVTAWDPGQHTIAGTFSGVVNLETDSLVITNGVFNATYPSN